MVIVLKYAARLRQKAGEWSSSAIGTWPGVLVSAEPPQTIFSGPDRRVIIPDNANSFTPIAGAVIRHSLPKLDWVTTRTHHMRTAGRAWLVAVVERAPRLFAHWKYCATA